jgi:translation initiation factor IF-1
MRGKEIIVLDATLLEVIGEAAFRAKLANGHVIVAFAVLRDRQKAVDLAPGERVSVAMSPYDMSKGRIRFE